MLSAALLHKISDDPASIRELAIQTPLQEVSWQPFVDAGVRVLIKREDLIHSGISGNKLYKLAYHLHQASASGCKGLLSFGGAYSNHLHALAIAAEHLGLQSQGVVRGVRPSALSPTLQDCEKHGMQLDFICRQDYARRHKHEYLEQLQSRYPGYYLIPEGGGGVVGMQGVEPLIEGLSAFTGQYDILCAPVGTGTTLAGLISGLGKNLIKEKRLNDSPKATKDNVPDLSVPHKSVQVLGFSALKGDHQQLRDSISSLLNDSDIASYLKKTGGSGKPQKIESPQWQLVTEYHCGGYAKAPDYLRQFIRDFERETAIPLDPVYTAKMMFGLTDLVRRQRFEKGSVIVAIHTGGLQGRRGYNL